MDWNNRAAEHIKTKDKSHETKGLISMNKRMKNKRFNNEEVPIS